VGYKITIIDPRRQFASKERFPDVEYLIHKWPDEAFDNINISATTAIAVLSHDPKIDDIALIKALPSKAFYVGALGSKKTQATRRERLIQAGLTSKELDRLYAPIGLDLGGHSPEEIALEIMAEIVQAYNQ
jgi:xanthine dehydrogenase accessory factor